MKKRLVIINGPNLNLQGRREVGIYGTDTFKGLLAALQKQYPDVEFDYYQSNVEGELINKLQEVGFSADGIILNAGGYSHTSVSIRDAVAAITTPVIEVHISNIYAREEFRHNSLLSAVCKGAICGFGLDGYRLAVEALIGG